MTAGALDGRIKRCVYRYVLVCRATFRIIVQKRQRVYFAISYYLHPYHLLADVMCIFRYSLISRLAVVLKGNTFLIVLDEKNPQIEPTHRPQ